MYINKDKVDAPCTDPFNEPNWSSSRTIINSMKFTTRDRDNELYSSNCAIAWGDADGGGWWYKYCSAIRNTVAHTEYLP